MYRMFLIIVCSTLCMIRPGVGEAFSEDDPEEANRWDVTLDTSSLERILLHPEEILADPDAFWAADAAFVLAKRWHDNNRIPLDTRDYYNTWLRSLQEFSQVPVAERKQNRAFRLLEDLRARETVFQERAIPLLDSFVPGNALRFKTTVYITGKTLPFAFMTNSMIVSDVLSSHFESDPDRIFNSLTHECYHIGYGYNRYLRQEVELENGFIYNTLLDALQNEGLATYVGSSARSFFPANDERDYEMLDDPSEVKRQLVAINTLFAEAETLAVESLRPRAWEIGVSQRGYYIAGGHMARTIDQKLGRETLLETIEQGPLFFIDTYNSLVEPGMKVRTFERPAELTLLQQLKKAALSEDKTSFERVSSEMKEAVETLPPQTQSGIERLGYGMIYRENYPRAIEIFELDVALFPGSANAWDCLAEAYMESGDRDNAIRYYEKALEVDPSFENAAKMLTELKKE